MEKREKLAALLTLEKLIKQELADTRAEVEADLFESYDQTGTDRIRFNINGLNVGSLSVVETGGAKKLVCIVGDSQAVVRYLNSEDGSRNLWHVADRDPGVFSNIAHAIMEETGEEIPGIIYQIRDTPPRRYTRAKVYTNEAREAIRASIETNPAYMLEVVSND